MIGKNQEVIRTKRLPKETSNSAIKSAGYHVGALVDIEETSTFKRVTLRFGYNDFDMVFEALEDFVLFVKQLDRDFKLGRV